MIDGDISQLPVALQRAIGPLSLAMGIRTILNAPGEPRLYSVSAIPNPTEHILGAEFAGNCGAVGSTWQEAAIGAMGELVERYCCTAQPELMRCSHKDLPGKGLTMEDFAVYSSSQYSREGFPFRLVGDDEETTWIPAVSMTDGSPLYVPGCLGYIPYQPMCDDNRDFGMFTVSTGQACHSDPIRARLSGLCEAIERDAFMLTWLRSLPATRIEYENDEVVGPWFRRYLKTQSLRFELFLLANDIDVPTMLCVVKGTTHEGPFACVGCAARPTQREAAVKALSEGAQGAVWVRDLIDTRPNWRPAQDYRNVLDFDDHVRLYGIPESLDYLEFLYQGDTQSLDPTLPTADPSRAVSDLIRELGAVGLSPIEVDITSPEVRELGLIVIKVLIPETVQLNSVHGVPALGSPRLRTVAEKLGLRLSTDPHINMNPHPFP